MQSDEIIEGFVEIWEANMILNEKETDDMSKFYHELRDEGNLTSGLMHGELENKKRALAL